MIKNLDIQFGILHEWIHRQGLDLLSSMEGAEYDSEEGHICYHPCTSMQNRIYEILHECGHHICAKSSLKTSVRYKTQRKALKDRRSQRSIQYRVEILREEFEAWENGLELAKKLNIYVDIDDYQKYSSKQIASYCDWISRRDWSDQP